MLHRRNGTASRLWQLVAMLLALGLLAAACGGDDDSGGGDGDRGAQDTSTVPEEEGDPVRGGRLVMGLEADTGSPWTPQNALCAVSCYMVLRSVFDPLTAINEDGEAEPYLLESFEPNEDNTEWTLVVREGIQFHDGTPLNAEAVADNIQRQRDSLLTGKAMTDVTNVEATDDRTVVVTTGRPWSGFPIYMAAQLGYIASPTWLAAVDAGTAESSQPVGTGPFIFESYSPGNGGSFIANKNPNYWREGADGEPLPYLDQIEFKVLEEINSRSSALKTGEIDIMHSANTDEISDYRENEDFEMIEVDAYGETGYILLNVTEPPLNDVRVRRAMAMSLDREAYVQARGNGVPLPANGPYPPGSAGYLEDSGYPDFDPEGAQELVDEYEAEVGPIEFSFNTTSDDYNRLSNEFIARFWEEIGIEVNINQVPQGEYINRAAFGDFEAFGWRNHGNNFDPDTQYIWWSSSTALPKDEIALNFGRFKDEVIDENLATIRTSQDEEERTQAAEAINQRFGEQVYNIWLDWTVWGVMYSPEVHNVGGFELPSGSKPIAPQTNGSFFTSQIWVER